MTRSPLLSLTYFCVMSSLSEVCLVDSEKSDATLLWGTWGTWGNQVAYRGKSGQQRGQQTNFMGNTCET